MSDLILCAKDDLEVLQKLCKCYNENIINNSLSETNFGDIAFGMIQFHQLLKNIHSLKDIHNKYQHIHAAPKQLYQIILDVVCKGSVNEFTLKYNVLYNNLQLLINKSVNNVNSGSHKH